MTNEYNPERECEERRHCSDHSGQVAYSMGFRSKLNLIITLACGMLTAQAGQFYMNNSTSIIVAANTQKILSMEKQITDLNNWKIETNKALEDATELMRFSAILKQQGFKVKP